MKIISYKSILILGGISAISVAGYLLVSGNYYGIGFPLDDAWIHQTYARNFAVYGEWSFIPGEPSGGSTSPLWGLLLSLGHLLNIGPFLWTFFVGWLSLWAVSVIGTSILFGLGCIEEKHAFFGGVLIALEWHLVWLACSGMETLLFVFVSLVVFYLLINRRDQKLHWIFVGVLIGVSIWIRPDGLTFLGPAYLILFTMDDKGKRWNRTLNFTVGFVIIFCTYLWFNSQIAGSFWPNTFFAKQAEYSDVKKLSFFIRLIRQIQQPMIGIGIAFLPGFYLFTKESFLKKRWDVIAIATWVGGYLLLYAWRLPVTYQHGRYVMTVIPAYILLGFVGMYFWMEKDLNSIQQLIKKTWLGVIIVLLILFWGLGAQAYAKDVAVINTEMVNVAHWLRYNTERGDLIAVHDIGAIGYFSDRNILDLAGLISPDVIPFIRDEVRLKQFLNDQGASLLVTFPSWYPLLVENATLVYETKGTISPMLGGENMTVYKWLVP